jgi:hypothetical protein
MSKGKTLPVHVNLGYSETTGNSTMDLTSTLTTSSKQLHGNVTEDVDSLPRSLSTSGDVIKAMIKSLFPFLTIMRGYSIRNDLPSDIMSGLIVGVIHIPQG